MVQADVARAPDKGSDDALRERWLARYGVAGSPVAAWMRARGGANAPAVAFTALVQDPAVLERMELRLARPMANDARAFAGTLAQQVRNAAPLLLLATRVVDAVERWERGPAKRQAAAPTAVLPPDEEADALALLCRRAVRCYPAFYEPVARTAVALIGEVGADGLGRITPRWAEILAFEAVLCCARSRCSELKGVPVAGADAARVLRAVQGWAGARGLHPLRVAYIGAGAPAMQAVMLSRDAGTLARIALDLSWSVAEAPTLEMWEDAEEMHAFAALALDRRVIMRLDVAEAERVASCATRYGLRAQADPSSVAAPLLPPSRRDVTPATVIAAARPALPNGVRQRIAPACRVS